MNPKKFKEAIWLRNRTPEVVEYNINYRKKHPEFEQFCMPEEYWYKIYGDWQIIHWAILRKEKDNLYGIYFININGRAFDKVLYYSKEEALKQLKKNKFVSSKKKLPPYMPIEPIFICLCKGKNKALYSKKTLWDKKYQPPLKQKEKNSMPNEELAFSNCLEGLNRILHLILILLTILAFIFCLLRNY